MCRKNTFFYLKLKSCVVLGTMSIQLNYRRSLKAKEGSPLAGAGPLWLARQRRRNEEEIDATRPVSISSPFLYVRTMQAAWVCLQAHFARPAKILFWRLENADGLLCLLRIYVPRLQPATGNRPQL
jgi:hypothetical protein